MIYLKQNVDNYNNDFRAMIQAFYPGEKIILQPEGTRMTFEALLDADQVVLRLYRNLEEGAQENSELCGEEIAHCNYQNKKIARNPIKAAAYYLLSKYCNKQLPWGSMTGIRPTKIATARLEAGWSEEAIIQEFEDIYLTTRQKGDICYRIAKKEQEILVPYHFREEYSLYIGIPFCLSRCLYCSFTSYPVDRYRDKIDDYLKALFQEMDYVAKAYQNRRLVTIYVGGGTPTALDARQLECLIQHIYATFDTKHVKEFTVEAGRPDSINRDKLMVLKNSPVTRISINPQTMNDATLRLIGRAHTAQMTIDAYQMARECGLDNINMDIIVGLPDEDVEDLKHTLDVIYGLAPDSLTVHSLAIKRAAELNIQMEEYRSKVKGSTNEMLMLVDTCATRLGMVPYYLYRQKNIPGNLENVGYCMPGKECAYNVLIMEEKMNIIAVGAGASTKMVFQDENRIERVENVKNVDEYMERIDEMIERKRRVF